MSRLVFALLLIGVAGCRQLFGFESPVVGDATGIPDAGPCSELVSTCAGDVLRTCTAIGELPVDTACDWGCVDDAAPHCGRLAPSGGTVTAADVDPATLATLRDITLGGTFSIDAGTLDGMMVPGEYQFIGNVAVLRARSVTVDSGLLLVGTRALAIVADQIAIDGVIDARGTCAGSVPGPGGFAGGDVGVAGSGAGGGGGGSFDSGGGGGGHGGVGGAGGGADDSVGVAGGGSYGDPAISLLVGGSGGGGGIQNSQNVGGGGGGAIQLVAASTIVISSVGGINAGGCSTDRQNCPDCTSGGGGAGGTILLESLAITVDGKLAVNGGGGAGSGSQGEDARLDRTAAQGGAIGNGGPGGDGAAAALADGSAAPNAGQRPGGGGGAVGRIRFHTRDGMVSRGPASVLSPDVMDPDTTTTAAPAPVQ